MRLTAIGLIACLTSLLFACSGEKQTPAPPPPPDVSVVTTQPRQLPLFKEFVGQTLGLKDIAIRARLEGFLEGIHFQEGSEVEKGALLYTLESQPFEEKVATRMSQVAEVQTILAKNKGDLDRIRPLAAINAVSQSDLDAAVAAYEATLSSLDAAKAQLRSAQIELGYTKIYSPINGIIGRTKAKVGDFVGKDPNPVILNTVSQVDTILVHFFITETQYLALASYIAETEEVEPEQREANLELILINGEVYPHKGHADFIDREVDTATGAIMVQASFPNPEKLLRPGQFAVVRSLVEELNDAILIPQRCVIEIQGLFNVLVVNGENKVETREIKVGEKVGSLWLIEEGLEPGEMVVYEGLQKAKDGIVVNPTVVEINSTDLGKK